MGYEEMGDVLLPHLKRKWSVFPLCPFLLPGTQMWRWAAFTRASKWRHTTGDRATGQQDPGYPTPWRHLITVDCFYSYSYVEAIHSCLNHRCIPTNKEWNKPIKRMVQRRGNSSWKIFNSSQNYFSYQELIMCQALFCLWGFKNIWSPWPQEGNTKHNLFFLILKKFLLEYSWFTMLC